MKKSLLITIIIVAVVAIVTVILFATGVIGNKKVELDLQQVSTNITEQSAFKEIASMDIDKETLNSLMQIEESSVEELVGKMPMMNVHASMYVIIKTTDDKVDEVLQKVKDYAVSYEEQWERYLPEQYELVKNRKVGKVGNYVYMIVAENAEELEKNIK